MEVHKEKEGDNPPPRALWCGVGVQHTDSLLCRGDLENSTIRRLRLRKIRSRKKSNQQSFKPN